MKQIVTLLLALVMAFSLCACGGSSSGAAGSEKDSAAAATSEPVAVDQDEEDYKAALALMDAGKLEDAIAAFEALDGYQDSADKIKECRDKLTEEKYSEASALMEEEKYPEAGVIFKELEGYEDSADKFEACREKAPYELTEVGDIIIFGKYEQDADWDNGPDPLEWRVLDKQDGKLLIITEKLIDELPYHAVYWKRSPINGFLNGSFLNNFTMEEREMIVKTVVTADRHPDAPDVDQGSDVEQKVFLLSVDEAKKYFAEDKDRVSVLTPYTIWFGDFKLDPGTAYPWWLRTAYWNGGSGASIAAVDSNGMIVAYAHHRNCALRPACWIQVAES